MDVYKMLPKTNCKDCGLPTCMALALQIAAKQKALTDCPHVSDEAKDELSEASAPPMKLVTIGNGENKFECGQETVMFRHDERFHHPAGIAVSIPSSLSGDEALAMVDAINMSVFQRVGTSLKINFCAVEIDGSADPAERAEKISERSNIPLILAGNNPDAVKSAAEKIKDAKPLIYRAEKSNIEAFAEIAAEMKVPLAITGTNLEELADLTVKAKEKGAEDILLAFEGADYGETLRQITKARRAALLKNFRSLGYPSMVKINSESPEKETVLGGIFAAKYASIIMINGMNPWQLLPILTTIQDVYTDPQVPNAVEAKLYEIGNPGRNSPVLFTTNFALTYFSVAGEIERSKVPAYISVVDTEGLGVLNSYAGDKLSPEKVVKFIREQQVAEKVDHRKLIIPGLLPIFKGEIEDTSEWEDVIIGPETARELAGFLKNNWKQ